MSTATQVASVCVLVCCSMAGCSSPTNSEATNCPTDEPSFVPYEVAPELQNTQEVRSYLQSVYPDSLQKAGIGGTAVVWVCIDSEGEVREAQISQSSGYGTLDNAAIDVAFRMEFSPAKNDGEPIAVWTKKEIAFEATAELLAGLTVAHPVFWPPRQLVSYITGS